MYLITQKRLPNKLSSSEQAENLNNELYQAIIIVMLLDINIINVASLTVQT